MKNNNKTKANLPEKSLAQIADSLADSASKIMQQAKTEEDLRVGFEKLIDPILKEIGTITHPRYERGSKEAKSVYRGRPDAVHGQVIIEYEAPESFKSKRKVQHAFEQLIGYLSAESKSSKINKLVGVGFDGQSIFFVQYKGKEDKPIDETKFVMQGIYPFNSESARTFLIYLRSLARLSLTAENLADKFGPKSQLAPQAVSAFADALENWKSPRVEVFFNEWKRLFGIVYGEQFNSHQLKEAVALSTLYKVSKETDFQELLFSVHTYFALLMKFIAAELLSLKESAFATSFTHQLTHSTSDELKFELEDIEEGGIYAKRGITNFLEGDFFRWYLDAWSPRLEDAIKEMARALSEFEPATTSIDPESTRDLLKKLYQYLVPQEVRQKLGEYYTPDWLAELILNEVGYDGNTLKRVLDPACGSGTFLVLAIQRAKNYGQAHKEPPLEIAKRIKANIWGFDLNPLAVIAARTNYLFALGDLINQLSTIEIPVYLADSVLTPTRTSGNLFGEFLEVKTSVQNFQIPAIWIGNKGLLLSKAAPLVERLVKQGYTIDEAMEQFKKEGLVFNPHEPVVRNFYSEILELEKQGKNGIWARFLKNAFAPMIAGQFDFVIGNPPWIRWGLLSQEYRKATLKLWQDYGLFSLKGHAARLGGGEKDFSMLFTYAAADYYLKNKAKCGFLITQEVYKSKGAGEGFRRFQLGQKEHIKVLKAHDLVTVQPFEKAANKTAAIIFKKGEATTYPVSYTVWNRKKGIGKIPTDIILSNALPMLQKKKLIAKPMGNMYGSWQTIPEKQKGLNVIKGKNFYKATLGARVEPYGVFWLEIKQVLSNGNLVVRNLTERGKRKILQISETIESELVYPAVCGADIDRWGVLPKINVLIVQDINKRSGYQETIMKTRWPRTLGYLLKFKQELLDRAAYQKYHADAGNPFYSQYNISRATFDRYKVIWKRMASDVVAAVVSQYKAPFGYKTIIPTDTISLIAVDNELEAHYLCAVINSNPIREFIKSFSSAGRGFGTPSVMEHVGIPKFDSKNPLHQKLAEISKTLHNLKAQGEEDKIPSLESQNDDLVKQLFTKSESANEK